MTAPVLTLERVSHRLADGRPLFSELTFAFEPIATGLVGRNGVGKSVLARLLAGQQALQSGRCTGNGRVMYVPAPSGELHGTVGALAGVGHVLAALDRIAAGSLDPADFTLAEGQWDLRERLQTQWQATGLPADLHSDQPAARLSGGQAMQVALSGAWASDAQWLILDEPSNHLDATQRARLADRIAQWRGGLLLISHDRRLLEPMQCIVELDEQGLRRYGGGYSSYAAQRGREQAAVEAALAHARNDHRQQQRHARELHERAQQRHARGQRSARDANQAPILLGLQAQRAQASAGRQQQLQAQRLQQSAARLHAAAGTVQATPSLAALAPAVQAASQRIACLQDAVLPHGCQQPVQLILQRGQRVLVCGDNGSGKSTLLRVLAGHVPPRFGRVERSAHTALLDQDLRSLPGTQSILHTLQQANPTEAMAVLRTRLALLGLDASSIDRPAHSLSAGERLKGALACTLYADPAPELLLLDEPGNALDLDALYALEALLQQYQGTLVMVSHDPWLQRAMAPTHRLEVSAQGWHLHPA